MTTLAACALSGTAVALYYYSNSMASGRKRKDSNAPQDPSDSMINTHLSLYRAPTSFFEDLYFFVEGLRFFYGETLFKWKTADLLFGLYYLCQNASQQQLADVGHQGRVFGLEALAAGDGEGIAANVEFLRRLDRCFRYNSCLRERRPMYRKRRILQKMHVEEQDFLKQATSAGVLKPSYVLVKDNQLNNIVLVVRGTHSVKDAFTSLTGASKPHHVVDSNGVTLGYSHFGMLAAARWLKGELKDAFEDALKENPGYEPLIIGHSLGGGAAAMLTMMLREQGGVFENAQCLAIACPACMTIELAESCKGYVTSVVNGCDVIPTLSSGSADGLRDEVMASEWYSDFHRDMRQYKLFRAFESTKRWVARGASSIAARRRACGVGGAGERGEGDLVVRVRSLAAVFAEYWGSGVRSFGRIRGVDAEDENNEDENNEDEDNHEDRGDAGGMADFLQEEETDSLQAEATLRMRAVQDAVLDAEEEEEEDWRKRGKESDVHVPSVIRPGTYGDGSANSPSSSPSRGAGSSWKRFMYPAGRIMHFVPAHVVPGYEGSVIDDDDDFIDSPQDSDDERLSDRPSHQSQQSQLSRPVTHERQVSELDLDHIMIGEGSMIHPRSLSDSHAMDGPLPPLKPAPGPAPKNMILVDHVPQALYGKMRPSRTILSDHVIPNYLRSLHSFRKRHPF